ncbi:MAG: ATP-dependent DNA helicase RecG (EC [uncultured Sulfurovum sp.]|uniref:ATP-dependent DNA helicase RecG (EC) n=1 Tax=uncultured Sulfurovum sp. TaxID=269237 RepID=A0A6S6TSL5_9BACT|nr:MAG: ATP-dependent DNA helicase RecG (EC [uncultured Sulfurovum sp.]
MQEAKALFQKLKIVSLLDLALLIPTSYNNTILSTSIQVGKVHTLKAQVDEVSKVNGKLRITFLLSDFNKRLTSMLFRVSPYHHKLFTVGSMHYIQGKVEDYRGTLQMNQAKSLKKINELIPKYGTVLKESSISSLIEYYITEQSLYAEGLNELEVKTLLGLHYPQNTKDVEGYNKEVLKFVEAFNHMKKLKGKREDFPALEALTGALMPFTKALPFQLTKEQQSVIYEVQQDLKRKDKAAKRLIIGDVGSGKTMVILAAAVMAYPSRSILMAPTSLLAIQLYEEAVKHLPSFIKVALVMQGKNEGDYLEADFIIGTHAVLYKEDLPRASLVMVDEQHRFGTKQRAVLENMMVKEEKKPHFLQFSATPIPRTQAMMQSELIDVSLITSTPFEKDISTQIIAKEDFTELLDSIKDEIAQEHQVLIVYPLVEESSEIPYQSLEEGRSFWEKKFDNVYVTHGKDKQKEKVLHEFRDKGNILLATTVVEVGISLPRLTLIVIVGAERLGLATLHQLRGRVGRLGLKSWCYLFTKNKKNERLRSFSQTMSGFEIAKLDLQFRNSGDILDGTIQSGLQFKWLNLGEDEHIVKVAKNRVANL